MTEARDDSPQPADGLPFGPRMLAVVGVGLGTAMSIIGATVVSVGLPEIAAQLAVSDADAVLIITAYQFVLAILVLPLAKFGEQVGFKRIYMAGLTLFLAASAGCALSQDLSTLVLMRCLQGAGAAAVTGVSGALFRIIYPTRLFGRGLGIHAATAATSSVLGPAVAGGVLAVADWPWLFAFNIPLGIGALCIAGAVLPGHAVRATRMPVLGAGLFTLAWALLLASLTVVAHGGGWIAPIAMGAASVVIGWRYWRYERGRAAAAPTFLPLDLLGRPVFRASLASSVLNFSAQMTALVTAPFLLRDVLGFSASEIALAMLAWPLGALLGGPLAGHISDQISPARLGAGGLIGASLCLFGIALANAPAWGMALLLFGCGLGFSIFQIPNNKLIMLAAPRELSGAASGLIAAARLGGQTAGAAIAALCFQIGAPTTQAALVGAVIAAAGAAMSASRLRADRQ